MNSSQYKRTINQNFTKVNNNFPSSNKYDNFKAGKRGMNEMITSSNLPSKQIHTAAISPKPSSSVDRLNSFAYGSQ